MPRGLQGYFALLHNKLTLVDGNIVADSPSANDIIGQERLKPMNKIKKIEKK